MQGRSGGGDGDRGSIAAGRGGGMHGEAASPEQPNSSSSTAAASAPPSSRPRRTRGARKVCDGDAAGALAVVLLGGGGGVGLICGRRQLDRIHCGGASRPAMQRHQSTGIGHAALQRHPAPRAVPASRGSGQAAAGRPAASWAPGRRHSGQASSWKRNKLSLGALEHFVELSQTVHHGCGPGCVGLRAGGSECGGCGARRCRLPAACPAPSKPRRFSYPRSRRWSQTGRPLSSNGLDATSCRPCVADSPEKPAMARKVSRPPALHNSPSAGWRSA